MTPEEWEETYQRFKEEVFRRSLNVQVRRGDPVRERDFPRVKASRTEMGLSDREIAEVLGLTPDVARAVRLRAEKERARPELRRLLYQIGNKPLRRRAGPGPDSGTESKDG